MVKARRTGILSLLLTSIGDPVASELLDIVRFLSVVILVGQIQWLYAPSLDILTRIDLKMPALSLRVQVSNINVKVCLPLR
jgi:hypothetical protein